MSAENCGASENWAEFRRRAARLTTRHEAVLSAVGLVRRPSPPPLDCSSFSLSSRQHKCDTRPLRSFQLTFTTAIVATAAHHAAGETPVSQPRGDGGCSPPHPPLRYRLPPSEGRRAERQNCRAVWESSRFVRANAPWLYL